MWAAASLACFLFAVLGHALLSRSPLHLNFVSKYLLAGIPSGVLLALVVTFTYGVSIQAAASLLAFGLASELYIFVFTLVSSSVSASLLMRLRHRGLADDEIDQLYSSSYMVDSRLRKLTGSSLLTLEPDGYALTAHGLHLHATFERFRRYFGFASDVSRQAEGSTFTDANAAVLVKRGTGTGAASKMGG
jgi:hypothetical protein